MKHFGGALISPLSRVLLVNHSNGSVAHQLREQLVVVLLQGAMKSQQEGRTSLAWQTTETECWPWNGCSDAFLPCGLGTPFAANRTHVDPVGQVKGLVGQIARGDVVGYMSHGKFSNGLLD